MLVPFGGTGMNRPPDQSILYSSCRRNSLHPWSKIARLRIARLSPVFCFTFLPGCSTVPAADRDMLLTCRFSTTTIAWFLLMMVERLCSKSSRALPMRA